MKYRVVSKILAFVLVVCSLTVAMAGGFGVYLLADAGLYGEEMEAWTQRQYENKAYALAMAMTESYAARAYSGFSQDELLAIGWGNDWQTIGLWQGMTKDWSYTIASNGTVRETTYSKDTVGAQSYTFTLTASYPKQVTAPSRLRNEFRYYKPDGTSKVLYYVYAESQEYSVTVWLQSDSVRDYHGIEMALYAMLYTLRYPLLAALAGGVLVAVACLIYLLCAAGKSAGMVRLRGLNRLPLDLYGVVAALVCGAVIFFTIEIVEEFLFYSTGVNWGWAAIGTLLVMIGNLCLTGFLYALSAQCRLGLAALWQRTLLGRLIRLLGRFLRYLWSVGRKLYGLLPLVWRYLLIALSMGVVPGLLLLMCITAHGFDSFFWMLMLVLSLLADVGLVLYGAFAYGTVLRGAKQMAGGEMKTKLSTRYLFGSYRECGENLNALAEVSLAAAREQLKSERMKTELITNVSHDIKTPLTSVINYIDLLKNAQTPEQAAQYLQVLDRQAQKLKKLIGDLMDMSRATTGDMAVNIETVDLTETINQALGEFADKLEGQGLTVVYASCQPAVQVQADGGLTWRVLSNLLSNVVKYALPGTRVYVDTAREGDRVFVSIKNISGEQLNVSAEELMERFVRGDASRNTEGSGLGLNIAKSLMQLQKGDLELVVDGDLFKVTLQFAG